MNKFKYLLDQDIDHDKKKLKVTQDRVVGVINFHMDSHGDILFQQFRSDWGAIWEKMCLVEKTLAVVYAYHSDQHAGTLVRTRNKLSDYVYNIVYSNELSEQNVLTAYSFSNDLQMHETKSIIKLYQKTANGLIDNPVSAVAIVCREKM